MTIRYTHLVLTLIGGLGLGAASASAHCGSCGVGDDAKETAAHGCPAACEKACCADSGHDLSGEVVSVDATKRMLTVKHTAVPGHLDAKTSGFAVPEGFNLTALKPGDHINARIVSDGDHDLLKFIKKG